MKTHYSVLIIGAGPGGLSVAAALHDIGVDDVVILEKGEIGEAWSDYPSETHLLSESSPNKDDNMIDDVQTSDIFPHIPHPSHMLYQKYLAYVATQKKVHVQTQTTVDEVVFDPHEKHFCVYIKNDEMLTAQYVVWAGGLYSTPLENMDCEGCYVHYARYPYMNESDATEMTVVGSANGATGVVMQLAKPGRVVKLVVPHEFEVPQPIDCMWKEDMKFVQDLEEQGLVDIVPNFRVKRIYDENGIYILEREDGEKITSKTRPIVCIGFAHNTAPIKAMVDEQAIGHEKFLQLDAHHQSLKQPGLYVAGVLGKIEPSEGMIVVFREFGKLIAEDIAHKLNS